LVVACWLRAEIEELDPFSENSSTSQGRLKTAVVQFEFAITSQGAALVSAFSGGDLMVSRWRKNRAIA